MSDRRTIVFFPEGAFGPTNNCVGIGNVLRARGHRVVFIVEESFGGRLEAQGFEERLMRLGPPPEVAEVPGQFWIDFIRDTAPVFRKSTFEQLGEFIAPTWAALIDGARYVEPRLRAIFDELRPDVIVEDNVVGFAAVVTAGRPWARIVSCNPAEVKDNAIPPFSSGYPTTDRRDWPAFVEEIGRTHDELWSGFDAFMREQGAPGLGHGWLRPTHGRPVAPAGVAGAWRRRPRWSPALPVAGEPGLGGRRPDAAPGRYPGPVAAPGHRQQGAAGRRAAPAREHGRRGVPAPARDHPAGRPGDHPRRQ